MLVIGTLLVFTDCILASAASALGKRYAPSSAIILARRVKWTRDELLHVQQEALEKKGLGPWKSVHKSVPVTEKFGLEFEG